MIDDIVSSNDGPRFDSVMESTKKAAARISPTESSSLSRPLRFVSGKTGRSIRFAALSMMTSSADGLSQSGQRGVAQVAVAVVTYAMAVNWETNWARMLMYSSIVSLSYLV